MVAGGIKNYRLKNRKYMNMLLFIIAVVFVTLGGIAKHLYKCEHYDFDERNFGVILGSVIDTLLNVAACYYIVKYIIS